MKIDRRTFMSATAVAINGLAATACEDATGSTSTNPAAGGPLGFDPQGLPERINKDGEFRVRARYWDSTVRLDIGDASCGVLVQHGVIAAVTTPAGASADVRISGPSQAWAQGFLARGLRIEGDPVVHVAPYRGAILRITTHVREILGQPPSTGMPDETLRQFDAAVGRYVYVRIAGVQYRIYFEEAGRGIPLMVQHLAGSDGRVWRHLIEDEAIQAKFRIIVYDLPFAGDLRYFANDHDLSGGRAERIDTSKVGVHFISGEYQAADSAGPNSAKTLAEKIRGSTYAVSKSGSHPIVEDYPRFRETLIPVLDRIHAKASGIS